MQFFLTQILARAVALYLCVDCYRTLRLGLTGRTIRSFSPDMLDWLLGLSSQVFDRDATPVRFWLEMAIQAGLLAACVVMAIFGWHVTG
jgi:hypothetical protein